MTAVCVLPLSEPVRRLLTGDESAITAAPDDLGGAALRLLHQLASATSAAEALSRTTPPAAPTLIAAMAWGMAGSALALETLQRTLSLSNRARDSLVGACLQAGLVQLLLQRLDWRSGNAADADNQVNPSSSDFKDTLAALHCCVANAFCCLSSRISAEAWTGGL